MNELDQKIEQSGALAMNAIQQTATSAARVDSIATEFQRVVNLELAAEEQRVIAMDIDRRLATLERFEEFVRGEVQRIDGEIASTNRNSERQPKEKLAMVNRRGISVVPMLTGEAAGYNDWVFKVKAFVRHEEGFVEYVEFLENIGRAPTAHDI